MKKIIFASILFCSQAFCWELAPLDQVRLLDSPFLHAQNTNKAYLLSLDPEKLLAPFRREAGLPYTETYGNWESTGLDGHIGGHYLSALSLMYAATGDQEVLSRLNYVIAELKKCQQKNGNGYIGGIPNGKQAWQEISQGQIRADNFSTNERWVPWYNLHKIFAGLLDAYRYAGSRDAKQMLVEMSDWTLSLTKNLTDEQIQSLLKTEHGGMNEIFVDVAQLTHDSKYLDLAKKFSHQQILQPLVAKKDQLTGLHANTQIPKIIGFKRFADATHNQEWNQAAEFFWQTVVEKRSVAIGGNSVKEHFHAQNDYSSMIEEIEGPETCNTYNMLRLTELLYLSSLPEHHSKPTPDKSIKYADYYERGLYNHILSSQNPNTGGFVYFTPMRPNHYRVYSEAQKGMWCCVGSGLESHSKYGKFIYARHSDDKGLPEIFVNLFIPSTMTWKEKSIGLTQTTLFPDEEITHIRIDQKAKFILNLRYPGWVPTGALEVKINNKKIKIDNLPGQFIALKRRWKKGDTVEIKLPMQTRLEQMPDASNYYAILHGPIVLAAKTQPFKNESIHYFADDSRMGHIANGNLCPLEASPFLLGNTKEFIQKLKPVSGKPLTFDATGLIDGNNQKYLELIPFFRLHESRYAIYWPYANKSEIGAIRSKLAVDEKERLELDAITIDKVTPGEQQPESDHNYQGEMSDTWLTKSRHWRQSKAWFSYELKDKNKLAKRIQLTYSGADSPRRFSIWINDEKIATIDLEKNKIQIVTTEYTIPESVLKQSSGTFRIKFIAEDNLKTGRIFDVRLLK
jgi:uncharacterized protein